MIKPTWNPFSRYADRLEKRVDKLLRKVSLLGVFEAQRKVLELMRENLVVVNLWLEARFKGYKHLSRRRRMQMYRNAEAIATEFLSFAEKMKLDEKRLEARLKALGLSMPGGPGDREKMLFLVKIMLFLKPHADRFEYLEGASFGKLLTDPLKKEKMIGDCNQIVTFYTFLFGWKYDLKDLQIKILPEHVCLHFKGIDIEATSGSLANYKDFLKILPIVELIATNLLDVSDFREKQVKIEPRVFLKAAHLANNLSSERELVSRNLKTAYHNVAIECLKSNDFDNAAFFLEKSGVKTSEDQKLLNSIFHNAIIYFVKQHNFRRARYYDSKLSGTDMGKYINEQEAVYLFDKGSLNKARALFLKAGNQKMVKACYAKQYNKIQAKVAGIRDPAAMKNHKADYRKMLELAQKMGDQGLVDNLRSIIGQL
jgi:hypothetical protein